MAIAYIINETQNPSNNRNYDEIWMISFTKKFLHVADSNC